MNYDQIIDTVQETKHDKTLNTDAPVFIPSTNEVNMCDEFSRFMVRKELVFSRLIKYDDQPMYIAGILGACKSTIILPLTPGGQGAGQNGPTDCGFVIVYYLSII